MLDTLLLRFVEILHYSKVGCGQRTQATLDLSHNYYKQSPITPNQLPLSGRQWNTVKVNILA